MIILTGKTDSYAQFITVLLIFVAVLAGHELVGKNSGGAKEEPGGGGENWGRGNRRESAQQKNTRGGNGGRAIYK